MGYGNTPSSVYKREMGHRRMAHDQETRRLFSKIQELERKNQAARASVKGKKLSQTKTDLKTFFEVMERIRT